MYKRIKVMQIMPEFGLAGAEIMVENLTAELSDSDFDVSVVSLYDYHSAITERLENKNIPIFYLDKKPGFDIKILFRLYKLFRREKPDVIHTHRYIIPYAIPAAILAKVPVRIHTVHNVAEKEVGKLLRKVNRFFYKYCKVIPVSISPIIKKSLIEEYGFSKDQVPVIYNGIDLKKCITKEEYCEESGVVNILHIGRFSEQKNHIELIKSFKIVHDNFPNAVLKLIGAGDLEKVIKDNVKKLNLENSVVFLGLQSNVYTHLYKADIFVLPSLWEGMPITLIEAMATGLPIVATCVGGVPDMIEHNVTGLLVDTNKEQISEALIKLTRDSDFRQRLGSQAKLISNGFSAKEMARNYSKLYVKYIEFMTTV